MMSNEQPNPGPQIQRLQEEASQEKGEHDGSHDSGRDSPLTSYPAELTLAEVEDLAGIIIGISNEETKHTEH